jgi:hypothetical protein
MKTLRRAFALVSVYFGVFISILGCGEYFVQAINRDLGASLMMSS